jgi:selenocysteine-specific elongation factor
VAEPAKPISMLPDTSRSQFVISLAGHIDHGKSSIVEALTGATVDRLPEERRRGITIELGFSHFEEGGCRFALIDVPGHEKFIHNMVAGASGVDAALLVIAADDSVMPQTREHLALLEMLGVRRGVIAITKCDLADDEQLELVAMEVEELIAPTFLAGAPFIHVSTHANRGIDELRQALVAAAQSAPARLADSAYFRMPIDRAFSPAGQGAVVTGTVWRGSASVGDTLHLLPAMEQVRIKRLQSQGQDVERVVAGERAAINLASIKVSSISRGDELATPDIYEPATRHLVQMRVLPDAEQSLRHRQFARLHLGSNQVTAQILMDDREVAPGKTAFAVVRCRTPIVAEYGQPFVLRRLSPAATLGGGTILSPALRPTDRVAKSLAAAPGLADGTTSVRILAFINLRREVSVDEMNAFHVGLDRPQVDAAIQELIKCKEVFSTSGPRPRLISSQRFEELKQKLTRRTKQELERRRPASQVLLSVVLASMSHDASLPVLEGVVEKMTLTGELVRRGERIGLPTGAELTHRQRNLLNTLIAEAIGAGPAPPTLREFAEKHACTIGDLEPLVQVAVDDRRLIRLTQQIAIDLDALDALRQSLAEHFQKHATVKVSEIRELWGITRKHAIPILEFFDQFQYTARAGDDRSAGPRLSIPVDETIA